MATDSTGKRVSVGYEVKPAAAKTRRTHESLIVAMEQQEYTFVVAPIDADDIVDLGSVSLETLREPLDLDALMAQSADFASVTVGTMRQHFDTDTVKDSALRLKANLHLRRLFNWAGHIGLSSLLLDLPTSPAAIPEFARAIGSVMPLVPYATLWIRTLPSNDSWVRWNALRGLLASSTAASGKVHLALVLPADLPDAGPEMDRWLGEPVAALVLPTDAWLTNRKGCPVLSKRHQTVVREWLVRNVYVLVSPVEPGNTGDLPDLKLYAQYVAYLARTQPSPGVRERFAAGYTDYLQAPLQPLMDHLEAQTYEVFERDPVKYERYQTAVAACLRDRSASQTSPPSQLVMVVGAGPRGPLVDCVLRASAATNVPVRVIAVEKNPNAVAALRRKLKGNAEWEEAKIEVVFADMREWRPTEADKCDILVSELLGSFGDNELSPECLDGVQHVLKANGVSIPQSYTPYLTPITSAKLHAEAAKIKTTAALETSYVTYIRNAHLLFPTQPLWTFAHPFPANGFLPENAHNERYSALSFGPLTHSALVHGFAGYFECTLYKSVTMSTRPENHTPDMTSWFPIYFPVRQPLYVPAGAGLDVHVWRCSGQHKVWYEWAVVPTTTVAATPMADDARALLPGGGAGIHNVGGRSHWIGL